MDVELLKVLLNLGTSGILLYQLNIVYQDGKADRAYLIKALLDVQTEISGIKDRLTRVETHLGMDDPPTHPLRPTTPL